MFWVIVAFLSALLLVSYLAGAKKGRAWGKVVVVLCVLALIGVVLTRALSGPTQRTGAKALATTEQARMRQAAELLGRELKSLVKPGCRLLIFAPENSVMGTPLEGAWTDGLCKGLGDTSWKRAGGRLLSRAGGESDCVTVEALSEAIAEAAGEFDAIVSFAGLPVDLEQATAFKPSGQRPVAVAFFPLSSRADMALIRRWIADGRLKAAVVEGEAGLQCYNALLPP